MASGRGSQSHVRAATVRGTSGVVRVGAQPTASLESPVAVSSLEHVTAAVNEAVAKVQNLGERVGILADRVFGQIDGDSREAAADRDAGDGTYGHLRARIGELERALGVLEAQLLRIEHV